MRNDSLGLFWYDEPPEKKEKKEKKEKFIPEPIWTYDNYEPGLEEALNAQYDMLSDEELISLPNRSLFFFDIECYKNYFLIAFKHKETSKIVLFEILDSNTIDCSKLLWMLQKFTVVGFNSRHYDIHLATMACYPKLCDPLKFKSASNLIIDENMRSYEVLRHFKAKQIPIDHIDIQEVLPGNGSLKVYAGRLHAPKIQDLPFPEDKELTYNQKIITRHYCINDLLDTEICYAAIEAEIKLRVDLGDRYGLDFRSKSDTQIGNDLMKHRIHKRRGYHTEVPKVAPLSVFKYELPGFVRFHTPLLNHVVHVVTNEDYILQHTGKILLPEAITELPIVINQTQYQMGLGGLHSKEKKLSFQHDDNFIIRDTDVTSYYPKIVLNGGYAPEHLGNDFLYEFGNIVDTRIAAKVAGDTKTANSLKITINGAGFGNFGNEHSFVFSPQRLIQTTLTGQLSILMLIEMFELNSIACISANTDGVVVRTHRDNELLFQHEWDAYVSFSYNVGWKAFCGSSVVRKLHETPPNYSGACDALLPWNKIKGKVNKGLTIRRTKEHATCTGVTAK